MEPYISISPDGEAYYPVFGQDISYLYSGGDFERYDDQYVQVYNEILAGRGAGFPLGILNTDLLGRDIDFASGDFSGNGRNDYFNRAYALTYANYLADNPGDTAGARAHAEATVGDPSNPAHRAEAIRIMDEAERHSIAADDHDPLGVVPDDAIDRAARDHDRAEPGLGRIDEDLNMAWAGLGQFFQTGDLGALVSGLFIGTIGSLYDLGAAAFSFVGNVFSSIGSFLSGAVSSFMSGGGCD